MVLSDAGERLEWEEKETISWEYSFKCGTNKQWRPTIEYIWAEMEWKKVSFQRVALRKGRSQHSIPLWAFLYCLYCYHMHLLLWNLKNWSGTQQFIHSTNYPVLEAALGCHFPQNDFGNSRESRLGRKEKQTTGTYPVPSTACHPGTQMNKTEYRGKSQGGRAVLVERKARKTWKRFSKEVSRMKNEKESTK